MKKLHFFFCITTTLLLLTGCGATKITRINLSTGDILEKGARCPRGDSCITDYNGGDSLPGGGIARALILEGGECYARLANGAPMFDQHGKIVRIPCGSRSLAAGFNPGHLDTLGGAVIHASAQVGSTAIQASAVRYKARQEAHSGPGVVFVNSNKQSQGQGQSANPVALSRGGSSASLAVTDTDVGVGVSQTSGAGSGGCGSKNCYDPTR